MQKFIPQILALKTHVQHELYIANRLTELSRTSLAAKKMLSPCEMSLYSLNIELYRSIRIYTGFCVAKYILPKISEHDLNSSMLFPQKKSALLQPLESIDDFSELLKVDENYYTKALAYMLVINRLKKAAPDETFLNQAVEQMNFHTFTVDHHLGDQLAPQFNLAEDITGMSFMILQVAGVELKISDVENLFCASCALKAYSDTDQYFSLYGIEVKALKGGKTKYKVSKALGKLIGQRIKPYILNFEKLWVLP